MIWYLNGVELGSGSQRINNPDLQKLVLEKWGLNRMKILKIDLVGLLKLYLMGHLSTLDLL